MWEPTAAHHAAEEYARVIASTVGVTRHERVYAAGVVVAGLVVAAAASALDAYARVLHVRAVLPHSGTGAPAGDLDEIHRGLAKGLEVMGLEGALPMTDRTIGEVLSPPPGQTTPEDYVDYSREELGEVAPWLGEALDEGPPVLEDQVEEVED